MNNYEFNIVLPSNSSMKYFPNNTTTCFTTQLPREINLVGQWKVGLTEIHIPCTISHILRNGKEREYMLYTEGDLLKYSKTTGKYEVFENNEHSGNYKLPYGVFDNLNHFVEIINNDVKEHVKFIPSQEAYGHYYIQRVCKEEGKCALPHYAVFHEKIGRILGYDPGAYSNSNGQPDEPINFDFTNFAPTAGDLSTTQFELTSSSTPITANRPATLARALPEQLFVYSDICEPYTVGDTQATLLRIVSFNTRNYKFGTTIVKNFPSVEYTNLLKNNFQNIVIDIRDAQGKAIAFEYGQLSITLHFKRVL